MLIIEWYINANLTSPGLLDDEGKCWQYCIFSYLHPVTLQLNNAFSFFDYVPYFKTIFQKIAWREAKTIKQNDWHQQDKHAAFHLKKEYMNGWIMTVGNWSAHVQAKWSKGGDFAMDADGSKILQPVMRRQCNSIRALS